jgi:hypothetical protein
MRTPHSIIDTGKPLRLTEEEYSALTGDDMGICRACGTEWEECEPDARAYPCAHCGQQEVYGTEELLMMGEIEFI